jgi:hypothetical protein
MITFPNVPSFRHLLRLILLVLDLDLDLNYDYIIPVLDGDKIIGNIVITLPPGGNLTKTL